MTGEIERRREAAPTPMASVADPSWATGLIAWADAADRAHQVAQLLAETSFVPKTMRGRPGDVTGAMLTGMEMGVPIMWALSHIDVVEGTPALRAKGLRALLMRHGHEIWVEQSTATRAIVCARRKGSARIERSEWTLDRAKKAELDGKKNWRLYPTDMLLNRATAEVARLAAPDVLLGGGYTVDELGGDEGPDAAPLTAEERADAATPAPKRSMRRKAAEKATPPPPPPDMPAPPPGGWADPPTAAERPDADSLPDMPQPPPADPAPVTDEQADDLQQADDTGTEEQAIAALQDAGLQPEPLVAVDDQQQTAQLALDDDQADDTVPDEPQMMTGPQRKRIGAEMRRAGITSREARLEFVAGVIGRTVASSNELTVTEASQVIQALADLVINQGLDRARDETGWEDA